MKLKLLFRLIPIFFFLIFVSSPVKAEGEEVVILISSTNTIYSKGITGFESSFYKKTKIIYLAEILKRGEEGVIEFFSEYEKNKFPFIVTFGIEATQLASTHLKTTPIVYSFLQSSRKLFNGQNKMCGFDLKPSLKDYYKVFKELKPEASKVYTFYSSSFGEYAAKENEYEDVFHGIFSTSLSVSSGEEFSNALENIEGGIDGFLMIADPIYDRKNFETLSNYCKKNGIVLMTIYPALVDMGATFAIVPDYTNVGEQTGRFAMDILEGKAKCEMGPTILPTGQILYFNENYATSSGLNTPEAVQKKVQEDEMMSLGLELYYKKMYQTSKSAFQKIIDKNPNHEIAKFYLSQLKYRLTKDETQKLTQIADSHLQKKQYHQANEYYAKVLRLNPDLKEIKQKLETGIHLESEEKRQNANSLYKSGKPFLAVKKFQEALQVQPSNNTAKSELESLRQKEREKIPEYFKIGLDHYNSRNYANSIEAFENILLVDPNNNNASEYLRLSKVKKNAFEKMQNCSKDPDCELLKK